jgi:peptidoglycan/LPS O-acetylase OafA/YrhL
MGSDGLGLFRDFVIRRAFRIYPLSICCVACVIVLRIPFMPLQTYQWPGFRTFVSNLLLIQNISGSKSITGPLWSLPWEMQMYLALPLLFLGWRHRPWTTLSIACASTCAVNYVGALMNIRVASLLMYFPCFLGGILALTLARKKIQPGIPSYLWPPAIGVVSVIFAYFNHSAWTRNVIYPEWIMCAVLGLLIPLFREVNVKSILSKAASQIAKYSYGIYLVHVPAMWFTLVVLRSAPMALRLVLLAILTIALPIVAYHFVESPLILLGKRLTRPRSSVRSSRFFTGGLAASHLKSSAGS